MKNAYGFEKTAEYCPHCECEVELDATLGVHKCPNCGKYIVACSMCTACDSDTNYCKTCCLCHDADKLNKELEDNTPAPPTIKKVYRFTTEKCIYIVGEGTTEEEAMQDAQFKFDEGNYKPSYITHIKREDVTDEFIAEQIDRIKKENAL